MEIPGGKRELGESITECAARELKRRNRRQALYPRTVIYLWFRKKQEADYGLVFEAQITDLQDELTSEIEAIYVMAEPPANWTYPTIQPLLLAEYFVRTKK